MKNDETGNFIINGGFFVRGAAVFDNNIDADGDIKGLRFCIGSDCRSSWLPNPPPCTGSDKALHWSGSSWGCDTIGSPPSTQCWTGIKWVNNGEEKSCDAKIGYILTRHRMRCANGAIEIRAESHTPGYTNCDTGWKLSNNVSCVFRSSFPFDAITNRLPVGGIEGYIQWQEDNYTHYSAKCSVFW